MDIQIGKQLVINAPEFFQDPEFKQWLITQAKPIMTWHQKGDPYIGEWADTVVLVDPGLTGEGAEKDEMPEHIWNAIVATCRKCFKPERNAPHIMVRLTNLS